MADRADKTILTYTTYTTYLGLWHRGRSVAATNRVVPTSNAITCRGRWASAAACRGTRSKASTASWLAALPTGTPSGEENGMAERVHYLILRTQHGVLSVLCILRIPYTAYYLVRMVS
ncbi:hypothetical protein LZ31DRAFT_220215 [Colletotrichum somersetense]|nr:hypothetical protein LZ31DRAFT_220215 [Colletotrichum somersetense]